MSNDVNKINEMHVEWWPIDRPKPYPKNARKWTAKAVEKVALSIKEFGWRQPIVCDTADVIVIGHLRLAAGMHLGLPLVPVHVADLPAAKIRALRLMDNRSHEEAQWDEGLLREEMLDLRGLDLDLSLSGFDSRELDSLLLTADERADECPEVPKVAVTRPGDLWLMGEHRLLCGDATNAADVARLLGERKPFLMVTDPPYGVEYDPEWRNEAAEKGQISYAASSIGKVENDERFDWEEAWSLFPGNVAYVWHASLHGSEVMQSLLRAVFEPRAQLIWAKTAPIISRGHYHW